MRFSMVTAPASVCVCLLLGAGCHLIFPFERSSAAPPGQDVFHSDFAAPRDGGGDAPASDALSPDGREAGGPPDGQPLAKDFGPADGDGGCNEPPLVNAGAASCPEQGTSCLAPSVLDTDCDGMLDFLDPAPSSCNLLRFADDLGQQPAGRWLPAANYSWSCGALYPNQGVTVSLASTEAAKLGSLPLVNVGLRVPSTLPGLAQSYQIAVHLEAGSESTTCVVSKNAGTDTIRLSIKANGVAGSSGTTQLDPGWLHVLQLDYSSSLSRCWLYSTANNSIPNVISSLVQPSQPVTGLQFAAVGIDLGLDYVHAFEPPP